MASIAQVRTALASTIRENDLRVVENVTEHVNLPAAAVDFAGWRIDAMGRGRRVMQFDVLVVTALSTGRVATATMDELVDSFGARAIPHRIWQTRNLGLDAVDAHVEQVSGYSQIEGFGVDHIACTISVLVHTRGDQ